MLIFLIVLFSVLFILFIILFIITVHNFNFIFAKQKEHKRFTRDNPYDKNVAFLSDMKYWNKSLYEEKTLTSFDNKVMYAYMLKPKKESHNYVVFFHGFRGLFCEFSSLYHTFLEKGFNILCVNQRTAYKCKEKYCTMGYLEEKDGDKWIKEIIKEDEKANIILFGHSMGAHVVNLLSSHDYEKHVKGIISDAAYYDLKKEFYRISDISKIKFGKFFINCLLLYGRIFYGYKWTNCLKNLNESKYPILFIHGTIDNFVPIEELDVMYEACGSIKQKEIFEAAHCSSEAKDKTRFDKVIFDFIDKYNK